MSMEFVLKRLNFEINLSKVFVMRDEFWPIKFLGCFGLALWSITVGAEGAPDVNLKELLKRPQVQVFIENDKFSGTDQYYTNGFKVGGGAELPLLGDLIKPIPEIIINLFDGPGPNGEIPESHVGFFIGQNIYTPRDISIAQNQPLDRPWAAWLYVGTVVQRVRGNRLDTVELDLGVVGPAALGRQVQSGWHSLIGAQQPKGWSNQIANEPAFLLSYLQKRRYGSEHIQVVPHAGVTVGTVLTLVRAGASVRIGNRLTGFGPDSIEPGGAMLQPTREQDRRAGTVCCEWYAFVGGDYRLVARNIFLDGSTFRDGPSVERRVAVHDLNAGVAFRYGPVNLSLTRILRSSEFKTAQSSGGRQAFYSVNIGWQFD